MQVRKSGLKMQEKKVFCEEIVFYIFNLTRSAAPSRA